MSQTREILTLQFGHYANFVGTHWWNLQEASFSYNPQQPSEINHDVLYREGITQKNQVTFTPRLLLVDLKGSLKSLPEQGTLYETANPSTSTESYEIIQNEPQEKNLFQKILDEENYVERSFNFEDNVNVWSDYLVSRFHPRSTNIIKEFEHESVDKPFDVFPLGSSVFKGGFEEDFGDKVRVYVEECDSFQGFHVLSDVTNSFGGLSSSCLEFLQDDYHRKSVLVFPVIPSWFSDNDFGEEDKFKAILNDSIRTLNMTLSFDKFNEFSSLFVPLCSSSEGWRRPGPPRSFYHTEYNHKLAYHSSAILAAALDTITLKHRLKSSQFNLIDLSSDLTAHGRKAAAASLCLPFSLNQDADLIDCLNNWEGALSQSITPRCTIDTERVMQHITLRGVPEGRLKRPKNQAKKQQDLPAYQMGSVKDMLNFYYSCTCYASATNVTTSEKGLPVKTPFPKIFDERIGFDGNVWVENRPKDLDVESVPVLAGLHNGPKTGEMLESLHTEAKKIKFRKFHQFIEGGIDGDEFEECLDRLFALRENYEENYLI